MQQKSKSNEDRTRETRSALLKAARILFVERGYADTSTPAIAKSANVTRGALYHHFKDKEELFAAILEAEAENVAAEITEEVSLDMPPLQALIAGGNAYLRAMAKPGRARLLLIDGPAILGEEKLAIINQINGDQELKQGLLHAKSNGHLTHVPIDPLMTALSAMFDASALAIARGEDAGGYQIVIAEIMTRLVSPD